MITKCRCPHCNNGIEFEAEELTEQNSVVPCPHCGIQIEISVPKGNKATIPAAQSICAPIGDAIPTYPEGVSTEAVRRFREGAARGDAESMANLGLSYLSGNGVSQNSEEGVRLRRIDGQ